MAPIIEGPPEDGDQKRPFGAKLIWFAALWLGGLIAVAATAYGLRLLIMH